MKFSFFVFVLVVSLSIPSCSSDPASSALPSDVGSDDADGDAQISDMPSPQDLTVDDPVDEQPDALADPVVDPATEDAIGLDLTEVAEEVLDVMEEEIVEPECPAPEDQVEPAIRGLMYRDVDQSSDSFYAQFFNPEVDEPLGAVEIALFSGTGERTTTTCPSGEFSFGAVVEGTYLLDVELDDGSVCTSTNSPVRFPEAVREGGVTIVTFGDSLPIYSANPNFPARLAVLVGPLSDVTNVNVAVPGSMTTDWLPGTGLFENTLEPQLEVADVVLISLGGNDLQTYFTDSDLSDPDEVARLAAQFPQYQAQVEDNLFTIIGAVQDIAPEADIVYVLYPNYAYSDAWTEYMGQWSGLVQAGLDNALDQLRADMSSLDHIILVDMNAATGDEDLDDFLMDELHLNAAGTLFWAREIFLALGGALVGDEPLGLERSFGFGPPVP